jgi:hypothetical protein
VGSIEGETAAAIQVKAAKEIATTIQAEVQEDETTNNQAAKEETAGAIQAEAINRRGEDNSSH